MGKLASYAQVLKSLRADGEENLGDFVDGPRAQVTTWYGMLFYKIRTRFLRLFATVDW